LVIFSLIIRQSVKRKNYEDINRIG
jgi:hypothetical protein